MIRLIKLHFILLLLFSCSGSHNSNVFIPPQEQDEYKGAGIFSKDASKGISITDFLNRDDSSGNQFYINSFLWRASLDVVSIAPLISTDAFGGTILTDWYNDPKIKNKRLKLAVFVKSRELRSDGITVKVYVQSLKNNSRTTQDDKLALKLEEIILSKARDLRNQNQ